MKTKEGVFRKITVGNRTVKEAETREKDPKSKFDSRGMTSRQGLVLGEPRQQALEVSAPDQAE